MSHTALAESSLLRDSQPYRLTHVVGEYAGKRVLGPVSLQLHPGQHLALVGRSGVGKSTLLGLMHTTWRRDSALVPQALGLVDSLTVLHNVFIGQLSRHSLWYNLLTLIHPSRRERQAIAKVLEPLGMLGKIHQRAGELSGGQRQRVAIARALYQQTGNSRSQLLLADEPVSALDGVLSDTVMSTLTDTFATSAIALHDIDLALRFCNRVVGLQDGMVVLDRPSSELKASDLDWLY